MNCDTALEMMSAMLDGELTQEESEQLQAHLAACESCRAVYAELAAIDSAVAADQAERAARNGAAAHGAHVLLRPALHFVPAGCADALLHAVRAAAADAARAGKDRVEQLLGKGGHKGSRSCGCCAA